MLCYVYRNKNKFGMFLLLPEKDDFSAVPDDLITMMGLIEYSFELTLTDDTQLIRTDAASVKLALNDAGYYFIPPPPKNTLEQISKLPSKLLK